jgi:hypothetical protein
MSEKGKRWTAKILMKDNATRLMLISNEEIRKMIIEARKNVKDKSERSLKSMAPIEMWVMKAVLKRYSDGKLGNVVCIEVQEEKKGESHGAVGLA